MPRLSHSFPLGSESWSPSGWHSTGQPDSSLPVSVSPGSRSPLQAFLPTNCGSQAASRPLVLQGRGSPFLTASGSAITVHVFSKAVDAKVKAVAAVECVINEECSEGAEDMWDKGQALKQQPLSAAGRLFSPFLLHSQEIKTVNLSEEKKETCSN